jgi:fibrillarin-like rRNA methylase
MANFDYGYFSHSKIKDKKTPTKKKRKILMKERTIINRIIANDFDHKFYDGNRINGYGGFKYDERWKIFLKKIIKKYNLTKNSRVLDLGAKKGFFMKDLTDLVPGIKVYGVEDHEYPIKKSLPSVRKKISYVSAYYNVKYKKNYFDFVHAHNSIYRYSMRDLIKIIKKINYISKKSHITIPVYYTEKERSKFLDWSLLGGVILKEKEWKQMFKFLNYKGDYYFSGPKSYGL